MWRLYNEKRGARARLFKSFAMRLVYQSPTSNPAWAELRNWLNIYSPTERKQMIRALSFDVIQNAAGICANRVRRTVPACMAFMSIGASFAMISGVAIHLDQTPHGHRKHSQPCCVSRQAPRSNRKRPDPPDHRRRRSSIHLATSTEFGPHLRLLRQCRRHARPHH